MSGNLYQFLYICFTLAPVPRIFTKLFKIPVAVLRGLKIKSIVYLDDVWSKEILMASNKVIIYIISYFSHFQTKCLLYILYVRCKLCAAAVISLQFIVTMFIITFYIIYLYIYCYGFANWSVVNIISRILITRSIALI